MASNIEPRQNIVGSNVSGLPMNGSCPFCGSRVLTEFRFQNGDKYYTFQCGFATEFNHVKYQCGVDYDLGILD
jgi:hypothetical protein